MAITILGRVQGGSVFYSSATSSTSVVKNTLQPTNLAPLVGDTIIFSNGDLRNITAVSDATVICSDIVTSIKGPQGIQGPEGPQGPAGSTRVEVNIPLVYNDGSYTAADNTSSTPFFHKNLYTRCIRNADRTTSQAAVTALNQIFTEPQGVKPCVLTSAPVMNAPRVCPAMLYKFDDNNYVCELRTTGNIPESNVWHISSYSSSVYSNSQNKDLTLSWTITSIG